MLRPISLLVLLLAAPNLGHSQTVLDSPLAQVAGANAPTGVATFAASPAAISSLYDLDRVRLVDVAGADGERLTLDLERIDLRPMQFGFEVDGRPAPGLLDGLELSVWKGTVAGQPGSEVLLSFSTAGTRGFVRSQRALTHWMPQPDPLGDWSRSQVWLVSEARLAQLGLSPDFSCASESLPGYADRETTPVHQPGALLPAGGSCELYECSMAIETDWQLHQVFGNNLSAQSAYVATLLAAASDRYRDQIDTQLVYPYVQFYTTSNDPWNTPDVGGSSGAMLDEFVAAWAGNIPAGARLGHMLSGAGLGGGVAYLSVLCDTAQQASFGVSGNIDGDLSFPVQQGPFTWDFVVFTHETGHNFGSPHTHDYNPQIDNCAGGACIPNGTIMSYCHICDSGGMSNITTFFHPTVIAVMKAQAAVCLPKVSGIETFVPELIAEGQSAPISVSIQGSFAAPVVLNYRFSPTAAFQTVAMNALGGGFFTVNLPAVGCSDQPELFVSYSGAPCGSAVSDVVFSEVGQETIVLEDALEFDTGWSAGVAGDSATTGVWERVAPVGTAAQPGEDHSVPGTQCFVTGQQPGGGTLGSNDVDGGKTTLVSPVIDLSGGDARIGYWRWFHNSSGSNPNTEVFQVDISNNAGASWIAVETIGGTHPESDGGWFFHEFDVSQFVAPTSAVQVRFIAKDDFGSLVEAAVDDFKVRRVTCLVCQPSLGFQGPGSATLTVCGEALTPGGQAQMLLSNAPAQTPAWFAAGFSASPLAIYGGTAVPLPLAILIPTATDAAGEASLNLFGGNVGGPVSLYLQGYAFDLSFPGLLQFSNAVEAQYLP